MAGLWVVLKAEDEFGQSFVWEGQLLWGDTIASLRHRWAEFHGVPVEAVEFEDELGSLVPLEATAVSLGWHLGGPNPELHAVPTREYLAADEAQRESHVSAQCAAQVLGDVSGVQHEGVGGVEYEEIE